MRATEYLGICDETGRVVGMAERGAVHRQGLLHRAVHIVVVNSRGQIWLQRRSPDKDQNPDCWAVSVGGHVDAGEEPAETAVRELREEVGLEGDLSDIGTLEASAETGWEFVTVYELDTDEEPRPNPAEITEGRWFDPAEIPALIDRDDFPTAPSLHGTFRLWAQRRPSGGNDSE